MLNPNDVARLRRKIDEIGRMAMTGHRAALGPDALILQGAIRQTMSTPGRGRTCQRKGVQHRASAPGDPPAVDTGQLRAGVAIVPAGDSSLRVGPTAEYAAALEYGTLAPARGRSLRFRRGPQINRKALAATLRRANAFSLARSVQARGRQGGIAPRPYMDRSAEIARPRMIASHISEVQAAILSAVRR